MKNIMISIDEELIETLDATGNRSHAIREAIKESLNKKEPVKTEDKTEIQMPDFQELLEDKNKRNIYFNDENSEVNKAFRLTLTYPQLLMLEKLREIPTGIIDRQIPRPSGDE